LGIFHPAPYPARSGSDNLYLHASIDDNETCIYGRDETYRVHYHIRHLYLNTLATGSWFTCLPEFFLLANHDKTPTKTPTKTQTKTQTKTPTKTPTEAPTKAPTEAPTEAPTKAPTKAQTKTPTKAQSRCGGGVISVPP
jgi:hypothetical protein